MSSDFRLVIPDSVEAEIVKRYHKWPKMGRARKAQRPITWIGNSCLGKKLLQLPKMNAKFYVN